MTQYYIDTENVGFLTEIEIADFTENDEVIFGYTNAAKTLTINIVAAMINCKAKVRMVKSLQGKNALDFTLVALLTEDIAEKKADKYVIVSSDAGYDSAIQYLNHKDDIQVDRISRPKQVIAKNTQPYFIGAVNEKLSDELIRSIRAFTNKYASKFRETHNPRKNGEYATPGNDERVYQYCHIYEELLVYFNVDTLQDIEESKIVEYAYNNNYAVKRLVQIKKNSGYAGRIVNAWIKYKQDLTL